MRRTTLSLAIVALLLGSRGLAQQVIPPGQAYPDTRAVTSSPLLQPTPEANSPLTANHWESSSMSMAAAMHEAAGLGPCDEVTGEGYCCPTAWYVQQGVRIMHHPKPRRISLGSRMGKIEDYYNDGRALFFTTPTVSTQSMPFETSAGYELTIGRYLGRDAENRDQFLEFTYFGLNAWQADATARQDDTILVDGDVTDDDLYPNWARLEAGRAETFYNLHSTFDYGVSGFNRAEEQKVSYSSRFDNFEVNLRFRPRGRVDRLVLQKNGRWRREAQPGLRCSYLVGFRGISLDEYFYYESNGSVYVSPGGTFDVGGLYDVRTRNDMIGLQIGTDVTSQYGRAELGFRAKGGVFVNFADQFSRLSSWGAANDPLATTDLDEERLARSRDVASVLEVGFISSYQLRQNLLLRLSYDLMWVSGVALAPEQVLMQDNAPERINHNGIQLFQSVTLGAEFRW
ncbi:MAG: BBP7 family outer membrane beta-barrel protein [Pirellulales bacterium]|nr:BBP7 family outer membrane beta-barrel protein [Pirellulales bacterium]